MYEALDCCFKLGCFGEAVQCRWLLCNEKKRAFVLTNTVKGLMLYVWCLYYMDTFIDLLLYGKWDHETFRYIAPAYACLDYTSMFYVYDMKLQTKLHHIGVVIASLYISFSKPMENNTAATFICYYAVTSAMAFHVNLYMGLRHLFKLEGSTLPRISGVLYAIVFIINLNYQYHAFSKNIEQAYWLIPIFSCFIYDDLNLLKWLMTTSSRNE